jgi:hypothetical protein
MMRFVSSSSDFLPLSVMTIPPEKRSADMEARRKASIEFNLARSMAINAYAILEANLGRVFVHLIGAEPMQGYAAFAAIDSAQTRLNTIKRLLELKHGREFEVFYEHLARNLKGLSGTRNKIVHWLAQTAHRKGAFDPRKDIFLHRHPDKFSREKFYKHEIDDFWRKATFYANIVFSFSLYLENPEFMDHPESVRRKPWREIFHEEIQYPPPPGHPLRELHEKLSSRPQSSGG